jgi:hypothetical protein
MDNQEIIYDLLKEIREDQKDLAEKSSSHREETIRWQTEAGFRLGNIEVDLREHKEGVIQNREALELLHKRVEKLEEPTKVSKYLNKKIMKIGAVLILIIGVIAKAIKLIKGL